MQIWASGCFDNVKEVLDFTEERRCEEAEASLEVCFVSMYGSGLFAL